MNHWKSTLAVIGIGQLISILTSTIVGFSIIFWISNEFKSPTALSLAILAGFLPQFVLGLFAGVYVDRWNRNDVLFGLVHRVLYPMSFYCDNQGL